MLLIQCWLTAILAPSVMSHESRNRISPVLCTAVWFGLLSALLFSGGEGIRLLPFPAAGSIDGAAFTTEIGQPACHQEFVHCVEKRPGNSYKQRPDRADQLFGTGGLLDSRSAITAPESLSGAGVHSSRLRVSGFAALRITGRAPPLS